MFLQKIILATTLIFNVCAFSNDEVRQLSIEEINKIVNTSVTPQKTHEDACADCQSLKEPLPRLNASFRENGADCTAFIDDNGEYGSWGEMIASYLENESRGEVFYRNNLKGLGNGLDICRNFPKFTKEQKTHFWVWAMAAIAWKESTCMPYEINDQPALKGDLAIGLFQLNHIYDNRDWRGKNCDKTSVSEPKDNIPCALDILSELLKGEKGIYKSVSNGRLYGGEGSTSYWEELKNHSDGGKIGEKIRKYPGCR